LWFDEGAAKVAIAFFGLLRHWKGEWAGRPVVLEPWQQFIVWSLFGWKRADGTRRFRTGYLEVARKNGKTTLAAGIGLFLVTVDGEPGAEVYSAATKKAQAKIAHTDAKEMLKQSPKLQEVLSFYRDNIHNVESSSKFEPLGRDSDSLDGLNVHGVIADEVHAWKGGGMWDVLETATGSRRQPLLLAITTAGFDRQSFCFGLHDYAEKVVSGAVEDDSFFGMIFGLDEGDDWEDEGVWLKANPNLGVSKKIEDMRRLAKRAKEMPGRLFAFLRLHLSVWTQADSRWISRDRWDACGAAPLPSEEVLAGRRCWGALDLSNTLDVTAWVLVFEPVVEDEPFWVLPRFFIPEENIRERVKRDRVPFDVWVAQGLVMATPGNVVDYDFIEFQVLEDAGMFDLAEVAFDPWNATSVTNHLGSEGIVVVEFRQGFVSMNPAMKALEVAVAEGRIGHGGNQVLTWMADNLVARQDPAGNLKPDKERSREKIDGVVALIMAYYRAVLGGGSRASVYEERGIRGV
jgi:phage terminase large subunit-like protein